MFTGIRHYLRDALIEFGQYSLLLFQSLRSLGEFRLYYRNMMEQMVKIGINSLPIVLLTGAFSGAVTAVQTANQLVSPFIPKSVVGTIVTQSVLLELAVVVTGLVLAGRVGARIAAELGTMRVTEQVDALEAMGLNSVAYLVVPRVAAGVLMFPVLYAGAGAIGILGGAAASYYSGILPMQEFIIGARDFFFPFNVVFGLIKSIVFGFLITSIACSKGYYTSGGAEGVGNSTTQAAVTSCVMILISNYFLAELLIGS